jgi:hypothetical protein
MEQEPNDVEKPITPASLAMPGDDDPDDPSYECLLGPEETERLRIAKRPDVSRLKPGTAIVDGDVLPLFTVGEDIIVERMSSILDGHPWLDTRSYNVREIDDETGAVKCLDNEGKFSANVSFKSEYQHVYLPRRRGK